MSESPLTDIEVLCFEYVLLVKDMIELDVPNLYTLNNRRSELHERICRGLDIDKTKTLKITDDLGRIDFDGSELFNLLLIIKKDNEQGADK